jgi:hypothetical protein
VLLYCNLSTALLAALDAQPRLGLGPLQLDPLRTYRRTRSSIWWTQGEDSYSGTASRFKHSTLKDIAQIGIWFAMIQMLLKDIAQDD